MPIPIETVRAAEQLFRAEGDLRGGTENVRVTLDRDNGFVGLIGEDDLGPTIIPLDEALRVAAFIVGAANAAEAGVATDAPPERMVPRDLDRVRAAERVFPAAVERSDGIIPATSFGASVQQRLGSLFLSLEIGTPDGTRWITVDCQSDPVIARQIAHHLSQAATRLNVKSRDLDDALARQPAE